MLIWENDFEPCAWCWSRFWIPERTTTARWSCSGCRTLIGSLESAWWAENIDRSEQKLKKTFWTKTNYLVWGRGDSSLIENKSFEAVEPWLGAAAGVDQLAAAPKLILFEGTDDFFGFSCATLKIKTRFSKIWMDSSRDQGSAVGRTNSDRSFTGPWGTGVRGSLRMRFGLTEVQKLNWLLVLVQL